MALIHYFVNSSYGNKSYLDLEQQEFFWESYIKTRRFPQNCIKQL